jgi:murein DD-endopeptidase MepM/ murein hydrolase activator NlpD
MPGVPTVNVRSGPSTRYNIIYQASIGQSELTVRDVKADEEGIHLEGKVYRWLQMEFPNGRVGWVRDDLVEIWGTCTALGYQAIEQPLLAFSLDHRIAPKFALPPMEVVEETVDADGGVTFRSGGDAEDTTVITFRSGVAMESDTQITRGLTGDACIATVVGVPSLPYVNVRSGPNASEVALFQAPKGTTRCYVMETQPDAEGGELNWFKLAFPDGRVGWVRSDLLTIKGDCTPLGYDYLYADTPADELDQPNFEPVVFDSDETNEDAQTPASGCEGTVISSIPAKVRSGPNTTHAIVTMVEPGNTLTIEDMKPQDDGGPFVWLKVTYHGATGWMRGDLMRYAGDCEEFGVSAPADDLYPVPMRNYVFTQGYGGLNGHWGWDLARAGEPIFSGPRGGRVIRVHTCTRCTPDRPSWIQHGIPLGDPVAMRDPDWGWGFGNHIIIRYHHDDLPASTQDALAREGAEGWHIFAVYAHLDEMSLTPRQELTAETQLGTCGNTGQSTGAHLHLEIRAGRDPDNSGSWLALKLLDPAILFHR